MFGEQLLRFAAVELMTGISKILLYVSVINNSNAR